MAAAGVAARGAAVGRARRGRGTVRARADRRDEDPPAHLDLRDQQARPRGDVPRRRRRLRDPGRRPPVLQRLRRAAGALEPLHRRRRHLLVADPERPPAARLRGRPPDPGLRRRPRHRPRLLARTDPRRRRRAHGQPRHRRPDLDPRGRRRDRPRPRQGDRAGGGGAVPRRRHPPLLRRYAPRGRGARVPRGDPVRARNAGPARLARGSGGCRLGRRGARGARRPWPRALVQKLSVSLVNTNSRDLLLACLESLRGADAEVVVLDNASEDGSAEAVRDRFPEMRVIAQDFRAGFGANHNTVIRATTGRYVYVLNEDTTADDWAFERIVAYLDAHPRVAALGPRLVYPDGRLQDSAWRFPTPLVSALGLLTVGKLGVKQSRGDAPHAVDWVTGAALVVRREALDAVGLFDEEFFLYSEEVDLQFRLRQAGWEVHYYPEATVVHHESQFSAEIPERRINEMWRSRHRYWRKHHSGPGARIAAISTGAQYALRAALSPLARREQGIGARMRLHARDAWRVTGPGLRELADEWNGRVEAAP